MLEGWFLDTIEFFGISYFELLDILWFFYGLDKLDCYLLLDNLYDFFFLIFFLLYFNCL
jgi:hypothetical protein